VPIAATIGGDAPGNQSDQHENDPGLRISTAM
jgi:hypothetical protein